MLPHGAHLGARMEALGRFLVPDTSRTLSMAVHAGGRDGHRARVSQASRWAKDRARKRPPGHGCPSVALVPGESG